MTDQRSHPHPRGSYCDEAVRELYTFLDGELTPERRALIEAHLDECSPCLGAFDFEAEIRLVIAQKCRETVPEDLRRRIAGALGVTQPRLDP